MNKFPAKTMGGYFQLSIVSGKAYYPDLIQLNTARNALEYILIIKGYTKVYLPYFTCEVLLEPLLRLNIPFQFYQIDRQLEPILDFEPGPTECMLYTNYFGLKQEVILRLKANVKNLIVDNAQAFFSKPLPGIDTFYSCRKFFGVPDGAYLQLNADQRLVIEKDCSADRLDHLVRSIEHGIEYSYSDFIANEDKLKDNDIKSMSALTQTLLSGLNYGECEKKRIENFKFLNEQLLPYNEFPVDFPEDVPAMMYPLLIPKKELKAKLIAKKIFVPTYWPNVLRWTTRDMLEYQLTEQTIYLPVDQRYQLDDMACLADVLKKMI